MLLVAACGSGGGGSDEDCLDPAEDHTGVVPIPDAEAWKTFVRAPGGSGNFGTWVVGPRGLPEYAYTLAQDIDPRADWPNTELRARRDHWHLVGNQRLNATAYNEGYVQVYLQDRGNEALDRWDPEHGNRGGGYSLIEEAGRARWSTMYADRPAGAGVARYFGMGYARFATCHDGLVVTHTVAAPAGDHPFVVDEVTLTNRRHTARTVTHYEVWDVNRHYFVPQLLRSGVINPGTPAALDRERDMLNGKFATAAVIAADGASARVTNRLPDPTTGPDPAAHGDDDFYPPDVFLVDLDATPGGGGGTAANRFITDGAAFWADPATAGALPPQNALDQPGILVAARAVTVPADGVVTLRYAFGAVAQDAPLPADLVAAATDDLAATTARGLVYFDAGDAALQREMAWHSYYLANLGGWQEYFEHHVANQGSAYFYLHGIDGAVRDFVFSAAALTYIDPALARETLLYAARMRHDDTHALSYSTGGHGELNDALIHDMPSDLELFLWWGIAEYVFATGDTSILASAEPFWPKETSVARPITEHLVTGARYLIDTVGTGAHGLVKIGSGDWDDSITFFADSRQQARDEGESVANTAMAVLTAPWAAALLDGADATADATAAELRAFAVTQRARLAEQWTGGWYRRAWFGVDKPFGDDVLFLLQNAFALAAGAPDAGQALTLIDNLDQYLAAPSSTAMMQNHFLTPPAEVIEGVTDEGASNPVLVALGIWGVAAHDPLRAWDMLRRNTMAVKADAYPDLWYGIWSGPDAQYTSVHAQAGQTWASPATPQRDYPVMNSNQHAGALLGLVRIMGLEPAVRDQGGQAIRCLRIAPHLPPGQAAKLDTPLVRIDVDAAGGYHGEYRPVVDGTVNLLFGPPPGATTITTVMIDGVAVAGATGVEAIVPVDVAQGVAVRFDVR